MEYFLLFLLGSFFVGALGRRLAPRTVVLVIVVLCGLVAFSFYFFNLI